MDPVYVTGHRNPDMDSIVAPKTEPLREPRWRRSACGPHRRSPHICSRCKKEIAAGNFYWEMGAETCRRCSYGSYLLVDNPFSKGQIKHKQEDLSAFRKANSQSISDAQYQHLRNILIEQYNKTYYSNPKEPIWAESADMLAICDYWDSYAGPDGPLCELFTMRIQRVEGAKVPSQWDSPTDWPCNGQKVLYNDTCGEHKNMQQYSYERVVLLREPYNIPGIWLVDVTYDWYRCF